MAAGRPAPVVAVEPGTLTEFASAFFRAKAPTWAPKTLENREDDFNRRIAPDLGDLELSELTRERIEAWLAELIGRASSRRMVVQTVATLRVMMAAAVDWGRMPANPAARLRLPKAEAGERMKSARRVVGIDELRLLFAATGSARTETMLRAGGEVGMRRGEIVALRWPDVDLVARRLTIRRQVVQVRKPGGGHEKTVTPTKSGRDSVVALSRAMARRLADWYEESVIGGGASADGYVWPGRNGGPMHNRSLAQALERACIRAGLVEDPSAAKPKALLSPHRLRHSAASVMLSAGVPVPAVAAQLTHANPRVTMTIYAHVMGDDLDRAASVFDVPDPGPGDPDGGGAGGGSPAEAKIPLQD